MQLLIDASKDLLSLVLVNNNVIIFKSNIDSHYKHSNYLMNEINKNLKLNNIKLSDIDIFICFIGPGSFTGVRVGVTVSKVLAWALNKDLYLINNLEALKVGLSNDVIISVIPDKKNYSYVGIYDENKYENYLSVDDKKLKFNNKNITVVSLTDNDFTTNLVNNLKFNNNVKCEIIDDYKYLNLINYVSKKEKVNPHFAKPLYLKKIDVER